MDTVLIYSEKYLEHRPSLSHPECPERLEAIVGALKRAGYWSSSGVRVVGPSPASRADLELVHDSKYVDLVENLSRSGRPLDLDTPVGSNTFEIASLAAGGTIVAGREVMSGEAKNASALVRPPGHHATRTMGGGFCYFNNLAIMIEALKREFGLKRVFVIDVDAHCGNGTEDIFYDDASVLYLSIHQDPRTLYPGTGFVEEIGAGDGEGYTVNVPMPSGSGDAEYAGVMHELFLPLSEAFKPELIAVSVGFDALAEDPLTQLRLSTSAYGWLARYAVEQAERLCDGRTIFVLEGGYALEASGRAAVNLVKVLTGERPNPPVKRQRLGVVDEIKHLLVDNWPLK